jgi:hypothetical protein
LIMKTVSPKFYLPSETAGNAVQYDDTENFQMRKMS